MRAVVITEVHVVWTQLDRPCLLMPTTKDPRRESVGLLRQRRSECCLGLRPNEELAENDLKQTQPCIRVAE